jgi:hypothetical protein
MSNASKVVPPLVNRSTLKPTVGTISDELLCTMNHMTSRITWDVSPQHHAENGTKHGLAFFGFSWLMMVDFPELSKPTTRIFASFLPEPKMAASRLNKPMAWNLGE